MGKRVAARPLLEDTHGSFLLRADVRFWVIIGVLLDLDLETVARAYTIGLSRIYAE